MTAIVGVIDIDPTTHTILGTHLQSGRQISTARTVLVENPYFTDDGVQGVILDEDDRRPLKGLKPVTRNEDGDIYTFDGRMPLINAAYALVNPRKNVILYTNAR